MPPRGRTGDPVPLQQDGEPTRPPPRPARAGPAAGLLRLRAWTRGERLIVLAGVLLAVALWRLPWHRFGLSVADEFRRLGLGEAPVFRAIEPTALENPNAFLGKGALVLAVAMVLAVVGAKLAASRRPVPASWHQAHLLAGAAALGLLMAKVAARGEFLAPGAWVAVVLAGLLAYAGYTRSQEAATAGDGPPTGPPPGVGSG